MAMRSSYRLGLSPGNRRPWSTVARVQVVQVLGFLAGARAEAGVGIGLLALLITYLPSIYASFSRRENAVALLETRAGAPPWGPTMIIRYQRIGWRGGFAPVWRDWEVWFADIEESHTSMPAL